ncbi:hypothetical protein LQZ18_01550 [Lachnospiraceae bacterium ZAX-1]
MTIQETADRLNKEFTELEDEREAVAHEVADLIIEWDVELEPIKAVMKRHGIPYGNKNFEGKTSRGIVIGRHSNNCAVYILDGSFVRAVNTTDERYVDEERKNLKMFASNHNLEDIKAGFDYVRNLKSMIAQDFVDRSNEIARFLKENRK